MVRIIVFGGRHFTDRNSLFMAMDELHTKRGIAEIIEGGATGADDLAGEWAESRDVKLTVFKAQWAKHGRAAGPIRNQAMLQYLMSGGGNIGDVGFPGGDGSRNMREIATAAGVKVWEPLKSM